MYGESSGKENSRGGDVGLSPRVRGILLVAELSKEIGRSIPACTGNPPTRTPSCEASRVYPRVYGGQRQSR